MQDALSEVLTISAKAKHNSMSYQRSKFAITVCLLMALFSPLNAHGSALDLFGYGARGAALGGAIATSARGHSAVYYNPAALTLATAPSFSIAFQHASFDLSINGLNHPTQSSPALILGFGIPLPFGGDLANRISLGFGFVLPQGAILLARTAKPSEPSFILLETRAQTLSAQLALGIRVLDKLSIGVGALALATLEGSIDAGPSITGEVSAQVQDSLIAHFAPVVGVLVGPYWDFKFALSWRGESLAKYSIPVTAELGTSVEIPIPPLNIAGTAQYDPHQARAEISYHGLEFISLSLAATYKGWSNFENPIEYPAASETYPAQPEPVFEDTLVLHTGIEAHINWKSCLWEPRLGYTFEPSPAPQQTDFHNYLSNDRHILGAGLGIGYSDFTLDFAGQVHALTPRTHQKDAALADQEPLNPGYPSVSHRGYIFLWAAELGVQF